MAFEINETEIANPSAKAIKKELELLFFFLKLIPYHARHDK